MSDPTSAAPASPAEAGAALALPRPPGLFRRWIDRHPRAVDIAVATVSTALPFVVGGIASAVARVSTAEIVLAGVAAALLFAATLVRRRLPFVLLAATLVATVALPDVSLMVVGFSTWVALYSLGVFRGARSAWIGFGVAAAVWILDAWLLGNAFVESPSPLVPPAWAIAIGEAIQVGMILIIPTLVGLWVGGRRRYEQALIARAEDLARERDQRARLAVSEERTRIAREMHDIVSHGLTVVITLSEGAAAQAEAGSDRAPEAMRRVAETGRESLAEMRRLLGVLRAPDDRAELAPQPVAESIGALVARFRDAGMPVTWTAEGPALPPGGVALAAYRIVQESLTNVLRHAPGARRVSVALRHADGRATLTIDSDMTRDPAPSGGAGRGLVGMHERAALHRGTFEAGPRPDGRWRVRAELTTGEAA